MKKKNSMIINVGFLHKGNYFINICITNANYHNIITDMIFKSVVISTQN